MTLRPDERLMLVPRTGPDREPRDAALAEWLVSWDFPARKYKVIAVWRYASETWSWWTWAEEKKP